MFLGAVIWVDLDSSLDLRHSVGYFRLGTKVNRPGE